MSLSWPQGMPVLSVREPWASAIVFGVRLLEPEGHLWKDVENRTWSPPTWLIGQRFAIHATKPKSQREFLDDLEIVDECFWEVAERVTGTAYPYLERRPRMNLWSAAREQAGEIIGSVELLEATRAARSVWAQPGQVHWCLRDPLEYGEPIRCSGRLGLWSLPPAENRRLLHAEQEALAAM